MGKMRIYLARRDDGKEVVIKTDAPEDKHEQVFSGQFSHFTGPFRTVSAAHFMRITYPNPHCQTVREAERLARKFRDFVRETNLQQFRTKNPPIPVYKFSA